jgi:hypothetical protein
MKAVVMGGKGEIAAMAAIRRPREPRQYEEARRDRHLACNQNGGKRNPPAPGSVFNTPSTCIMAVRSRIASRLVSWPEVRVRDL